jgi:PAS domain S-box-containing protein
MHLFSEKDRLTTFARNANLSVCALDENLRITWGSAAFHDLFKMEEEECLGLSLAKLLFTSEKPSDEYFALFHEAYTQPIAGGILNGLIRFPKGSGLDLKVFTLTENEGFIVSFSLLLNQQALEREIDLIRSQLDELVQHTAIPVCYNDFEGKFIKVNEAFCKLFGRKEDELIGHDFMEFHFGSYSSEEQLELRKEVYYSIREKDVIRKTIELQDKQGSKATYDMVLRAVILDGIPAISAQLIQQQAKEVPELKANRDEVTSFAHETAAQLRKPLANLKGLVEMLRSGTNSGVPVHLDPSALVLLSAQLNDAVEKVNEVVYGLDHVRHTAGNAPTEKVDSVWIVDDDQVITYITEHMLRNADSSLHISTFLSAKMALEKLRLDGFAPDVLLLDINMPGITGWEFLDQLKSLNLNATVYMYSSSIDPDDVKEARNYPMVKDFISKPLDARTIRKILAIQNEKQRKVS